MRSTILLLILVQQLHSQTTVTTESFSEKRWIINSSINLPTVKFHLADSEPDGLINDDSDPRGYLELFSSFGVGFSLNYGNTDFKRDVSNSMILSDETQFSNIVGVQIGVLYSSKLNETKEESVNEFSIYSGINVLDLQLGFGFELGERRPNATRWFFSLAYGISINKLTGKGSHIFKKRRKKAIQPSSPSSSDQFASSY